MFFASMFNQPLSEWDSSQVYDMSGMFHSSSFNQPMTDWNTSGLLEATNMFFNARDFDQKLCWSWDKTDVSVDDLALETTAGSNRETECEVDSKTAGFQLSNLILGCSLFAVSAPLVLFVHRFHKRQGNLKTQENVSTNHRTEHCPKTNFVSTSREQDI
eukprot:CAMPEP_0184010162 /NCGR_PEP_ID=MMETSP0954-20121128/3046_1 /TAXON_ID=627963 /ORGANISM="Aplanochytrium sp, Strain PBS07" /LENGTH=158 /DNA_ID=CAMNT_0026289693 /DNA_START=1 /DNA_END=477 /DNA_ORIENTATION=+